MDVRKAVCAVLAHRYTKAYYPDSDDGAFFLRCRRCGKERDAVSAETMNKAYHAWGFGIG